MRALRHILHRSDIPFDADDAHRFLPWLIGVMACLVTLLLCFGVTLNGWIIDRSHSFSQSFTVHIPADAENPADANAKVREALRKTPGAGAITETSDEKLKQRLKDWLGTGDALDALPMPIELEVAVVGKTSPDYERLQQQLNTLVPGTEVDAHERWAAAFSDFSATMQCLMILLAACLVSAMAVMIVFTSRAALRLHARSVQLLHAIGAEDDYIARQFQQESLLLVLPGAFFGCAAAGLIYWLAGIYMAALPAAIFPTLTMTKLHIALLFFIVSVCGLGAWQVTRVSVLGQLQRTL